VAALHSRAVDAHLESGTARGEELFAEANMQAVRDWTESLWGSAKNHPDQAHYFRFREIPGARPVTRQRERMPPRPDLRQILIDQGRHCRFCGIPLVGRWVRAAITAAYPHTAPWGNSNAGQHAALQCMWLQFDHLVPWSRGGDNRPDNIVVTCAPCNYGRQSRLLAECGLLDPRDFPPIRSDWDELERFPHNPL